MSHTPPKTEIEPPARHRQRRRTYAVVCCAHTSLVRGWSAKEWAAALRRKRAASREVTDPA